MCKYEQLYIYVDGAYSTSYPDRYSGAFVVIDPQQDKVIATKMGCGTKAVSMRNVAGELSAVMRAIQYAYPIANNVVIFYDYLGIEYWVTGEWKTNKPETKAYKEFMEKYKDKIQFVKVKAHSGNKYNERVDQTAKASLMENRKWN